MIIKKRLFVLGLLALFVAGCSNSYNVVIKGGTIYDGMGGAPYVADIGVTNGTIRTIGDIKTTTGLTIDAKGSIVAPGFIDIHTHCDSAVSLYRRQTGHRR